MTCSCIKLAGLLSSFIKTLSLLFLGCFFLRPAEGWGQEGHEIVANIAYRRLSPQVRATVDTILGNTETKSTIYNHLKKDDDDTNTPLGNIANWADEIRYLHQYHWTAPLHYVDVRDKDIKGGCPVEPPSGVNGHSHKQSNCVFVYARDCPNDVCVAGAVTNYTRQLHKSYYNNNIVDVTNQNAPGDNFEEVGARSMTRSTTSRRRLRRGRKSFSTSIEDSNEVVIALKFMTHFIGDIHQPLHVSRTSDKGGNEYQVHFEVTSAEKDEKQQHQQQKQKQLVARAQQRSLILSSNKLSWLGFYYVPQNSYDHHHHWNLHSVWDTAMIDLASGGNRTMLEHVIEGEYINSNEEQVMNWLSCSDGRMKKCTYIWAEESLEDAYHWAYRNTDGTEVVSGSTLGKDYYETRIIVVKKRLAAAAVRLAASLELAFSANY